MPNEGDNHTGRTEHSTSKKVTTVQSHFDLQKAVMEGDIKIIKLLYSSGEDINKPGKLGFTALQVACVYELSQVVQYLIDLGSDVNLAGRGLPPPLYQATDNRNVDIVKILCSQESIELDKCNSYNETALHLACSNQHIEVVDLLVTQGASLTKEDAKGRTPLFGRYGIAEHLALKTPFVQNEKYSCMEAFHAAVHAGNVTVVDYLRLKGFSINLKDSEGSTAGDIASSSGHNEMIDYLHTWEKDKL